MSSDDDEALAWERSHQHPQSVDLHPLQAQVTAAVDNFLESGNPDRGLIQLATGIGKLYLIASICIRLLDSGRYQRILIITDTRLAAEQIVETFRRQSPSVLSTPSAPESMVELLGQRFSGAASILIATIQRLVHNSADVESSERLTKSDFAPRSGNQDIFASCDLVIAEETRQMMQLSMRSVLERIPVPLIGFTSNADSKSLEFFGGRLLWKYTPEQAVEDGYILNYDVFRLESRIYSPRGAVAGSADDVIDAPDEAARAVLNEFRALLFSTMFPGRTIVPKTLIYARSDSHADEIVRLCREVFEGNADFAVKITSNTEDPRALLDRFCSKEAPRIVVTVSLLATGVDIPPLECIVFMRDVRSEALFQQMLARGSRRIDPESLELVTPDAPEKTRFVVVDAVGVTDDGHFAQDSHIPRRRQHLLDGRRVRIADLLSGGLLASGTYLRYKPRQRADSIATAKITEDGAISLLDGREFRSPSAAASAVAGYPLDGWHAWITEDEDASLDELRQALLTAALDDLGQEASETNAFLRELEGSPGSKGDDSGSSTDEEINRKVRRLAELKDIRRGVEESETRKMTVRDLIALWGARGRDSSLVNAIEADLANYGLLTDPDFRMVTLEDEVVLKLTAEDDAPTVTEAHPGVPAQENSKSVTRKIRHERGLTIGNLPSATRTIESVSPNSTFEQAITKMLVWDYSQLAVMSGERNLRGAVTWRSIAKVRHRNPDAQFSSAVVRAAEVSYQEDLVDVLPRLATDEFVFVRGPKGNISGIVTASDIIQTYGEMTSPFFTIGEIDQTLRWILETCVDLDMVLSLCDSNGRRKIESFSSLTMGDYQRVLENPEAWGKLDWPLDRRVFSERLEEIREIRNNIMHFNGDPLPSDVLSMLKNFLSLLREYSDS